MLDNSKMRTMCLKFENLKIGYPGRFFFLFFVSNKKNQQEKI